MIDNRGLLATVTTLAVIGVLALFIYSATLEPLAMDIGEIDQSDAGSIVRTRGTVTGTSTFPDGSSSMQMSDLNTSSSISVYIPAEAAGTENLVPGTVVEVLGEVSVYLESVEITVARAADITVISPPTASEFELAAVMQSIQMFDGLEISTSGEILDLDVMESSQGLVGTAFRLTSRSDNQTYYLDCLCFDRDLNELYSEWDSVRVTGVISYFANSGRWQMTVEIISPA